MFVANASDQEVFSDQMVVEHIPQLMVQENHYYPFGLELAGFNKRGKPEHRWKFTGVELMNDFDLQWYDYKYRKNYNSQIGRFFSIDPIAEEYIYLTPYQHASNNPVTKIELEGLEGVQAKGQNNQANKAKFAPVGVAGMKQTAQQKASSVLRRQAIKWGGRAAKFGRGASPFGCIRSANYILPIPYRVTYLCFIIKNSWACFFAS